MLYYLSLQMYPSIQAKIWGNIGMVSDLFDMVLDSFIKVGVNWGGASIKAGGSEGWGESWEERVEIGRSSHLVLLPNPVFLSHN